MIKKYSYIVLLLIISAIHLQAQKNKPNDPIRYKAALTYFLEQYPDLIFLTDPVEVIFTQKGKKMTCDSAVYNQKEQFFRCFKDVKINIGDTVFMTSNYLEYNAKNKLSMAEGNVLLRNKRMNLSTQKLFFDRNLNEAYYNEWGTIKDEENTMVSKSARYYLNQNYIDFTQDVTIVTNVNNKAAKKKYTVTSNHLKYFTNLKEVEVLGPTNIINKNDPKEKMYTESGRYNTRTNIATSDKAGIIYSGDNILKANHITNNQNTQIAVAEGSAVLYSKDNELYANHLMNNKKTGVTIAKGNVKIINPKDKIVLTGQEGIRYSSTVKGITYDSIIITNKAFIRKQQEKDSIYFTAKKMIAVKNPDEKYTLYGYQKAKMLGKEMQAKSDSIIYNEGREKFELYKDPILWYKDMQLTGDSIIGFTKKQKLDSVVVKRNAFAISKVDSLTTKEFNQVKGRFLYALFRDYNNDLNFIHVEGNAQSLFYADEEKKENKPLSRIGINRSDCAFINAAITRRELDEISCMGGAKSIMKPEELMPEEERYLEKFLWRDKEKFATKNEFLLFVHREDETYEPLMQIDKPLNVNKIQELYYQELLKPQPLETMDNLESDPKGRSDQETESSTKLTTELEQNLNPTK